VHKHILHVLCLLCLISTSPASAEFRFTPVAAVYANDYRDLSLSGDRFSIAGVAGVQIFHSSETEGLELVHQIIRPDGACAVAEINGGLAVGTGSDSVLLYSYLPDGELIYHRGFSVRGDISHLTNHDECLYVADRVGWQRINVQQSATPIVDFVETIAAPVSSFAFKDDSLFVSRTDGLTIVYHVRGNPQAIGVMATPEQMTSLTFRDTLGYLGVGDSGVYIYDLDDGLQTERLARFYTYGHVKDIKLLHNYLFVADTIRGMMVMGLFNPLSPYLFGVLPELRGFRRAVYPDHRLGAITAGTGYVIDISNQIAPMTTGRISGDANVRDVVHDSGYIFVADEHGTISSFETNSVIGPVKIAEHATEYDICGMDLQDGLLAVAAGADGLVLFDARDPENLVQIGHRIASSMGKTVAVNLRDSLAAIADFSMGFLVYDVHDPDDIEFLGGGGIGQTVIEAYSVRDNVMYALGPHYGFGVFDVSVKMKPFQVFHHGSESHMTDMHATDEYVFVGVENGEVLVFDISAPTSPHLVDTWDFFTRPLRITGRGRLLFVLDESEGVVALDFRAPGDVQVLQTTPLYVPGEIIEYDEPMLYVAGPGYLHALRLDPEVIAGDVNEDGIVSLADVVSLVNFLLRGGMPPLRTTAADVSGDGRFNIVDLVRLIRHLYPNT